MSEETKNKNQVNKTEKKTEHKIEHNHQEIKQEHKLENKSEHKHETPQQETKVESKVDSKEQNDKKPAKKETPRVKKYEAVARGFSLPISKKHSMYISNAIKGKKIDDAISYLQGVIKFKYPVPMKGEIPHRRGSIMSGRYPISASKHFINMLKALKGNVIVNGLELERTVISESSASWAARPQRSGGRRAKRVNLIMKAREVMEAKK